MRFDPPPVRLTPELHWVLLRSFGPADLPTPPGKLDAEKAFAEARLHSLGSRVAARHLTRTLHHEMGEVITGRLRELYVATAERTLVLAGLARLVAEIASSAGQPVVFLKGTALQLAGVVPPGWREAVDVDVLATRSGAASLHRTLQEHGCTPLDIAECEHHLQPLRHSCGRCIEIHADLEGLRLENAEKDVDAADLIRLGRVAAAPGHSPQAWIPTPDVMTAHLLIHALLLHGDRPRDYPLMRVVGDLMDLVPDAAAWQASRPQLLTLARGLAQDELDAMEEICLGFQGGRLPVGAAWAIELDEPRVVASQRGGERLLRHLLAGRTDRDYAESLRVGSFLRPVSGARLPGLARRASRTVFLDGAQVDEIYGRPETRLGYWLIRLLRPFDLVRRTVRTAAARRRTRRRLREVRGKAPRG